MCKHDIVVLESGTHDFGMPFTQHVTWATNHVRPKCAGMPDAECEAALTLLEQVPRQLAWPLQALLCFCLPVVGVETSFRITQGLIEDRGPRATVDECLDVLTRREYLRRQTRGARSAHSS